MNAVMRPAVSNRASCEKVAPIFETYKGALIRFVKSRINDAVDSEEMVSEILMKVYDNCEKLENIRHPESWLIAVSRNAIADYYRKGNREMIGEVPDDPAEEEASIDYSTLTECLPGLIDKLPSKYADPLRQYELKGIPQKELAIQYGMSESGLKSRVQRGRKMLRELFIAYCGEALECECQKKNC